MYASFVRILTLLSCLLAAACARASTWADDPAAYLSSPAGRHATIGRSRVPCLSAAEAEAQAIEDATQQLALRLGPASRVEPGEERDAIRAALAAGRYVRDRSLKVTARPYGEIWSGAVLVEISSAQLASECARRAEARSLGRAGRLAGVTGILAVVGLAYLAANAITRGYFRRRLRFIALLACAAPFLLIWWAR